MLPKELNGWELNKLSLSRCWHMFSKNRSTDDPIQHCTKHPPFHQHPPKPSFHKLIPLPRLLFTLPLRIQPPKGDPIPASKTRGYPVVFTVFTSDDLSSCVGLALQEGQHHRGLVRAVHTGLNSLLQHCVDWSRPKVDSLMLHLLLLPLQPQPLPSTKQWSGIWDDDHGPPCAQGGGARGLEVGMRSACRKRNSWKRSDV
ncbi:hypothetical protein F7725_026505 [Dissostichus mawsoni]|uniref:Uncharacterized protein n=1 Tax=Dissostichus mawsoni TaxID=36200 RepID=A0A7J5X767_DISMA|nr:hypothetical protein F7725_026505 [Dissostichus mawsoni]